MWTQGEPAIVGWGKIDHRRNEIVYEQLPLNTLFFPVYFDDETMLGIAEPFMIYADKPLKGIPLPLTMNKLPRTVKEVSVKEGEIVSSSNHEPIKELRYITLKCDTTQRINLHLLRKYPEKRRMKRFQEGLKGTILLGSDQERGKTDTLLTINDIPKPYLQEYRFDNAKCYCFYRFATPDGSPVNIAHIEFLATAPMGNRYSMPTPLPVFWQSDVNKQTDNKLFRIDGRPLKTGSHPEHAFDNDMSTYVGAPSVGMEYAVPVQIDRIRLVPRTANNIIVPGNSYLLMYYDKGWKEFKILYAEHNFLDFENVPKATLYWLRNLTEGKEELPFFYINGKQYFMHTDSLPSNE